MAGSKLRNMEAFARFRRSGPAFWTAEHEQRAWSRQKHPVKLRECVISSGHCAHMWPYNRPCACRHRTCFSYVDLIPKFLMIGLIGRVLSAFFCTYPTISAFGKLFSYCHNGTRRYDPKCRTTSFSESPSTKSLYQLYSVLFGEWRKYYLRYLHSSEHHRLVLAQSFSLYNCVTGTLFKEDWHQFDDFPWTSQAARSPEGHGVKHRLASDMPI